MTNYHGTIKDPRTALEKSFDFTHEELARGIETVDWKYKPREEWKEYRVRSRA